MVWTPGTHLNISVFKYVKAKVGNDLRIFSKFVSQCRPVNRENQLCHTRGGSDPRTAGGGGGGGWPPPKIGIPNFVSGPGEYIMEGEYVILKITGLLYLYWAIRLGCYAMGLPMGDSVRNYGRSLVLWVPETSGSIGNGILGEYFPEREYNLLGPKKTRKRQKFQPCRPLPENSKTKKDSEKR